MSGLGANLRDVRWDQVQLVPFKRNFYQEHPTVARMSKEEVQDWYRQHSVIMGHGTDIPNPIRTFEEASYPSYVMESIREQKFVKPTIIQSLTWPVALQGRDCIGIAETGSGKTLAFCLPSLLHIKDQPPIRPGDGPVALVLAPTRELAKQIDDEYVKYGRSARVRTICVYGGTPKGPQARQLRSGVEVVIATPGRLIDLLEMGCTNLQRVTYLVIDEADRMLDMGFEPQLRKIVGQVRPDRQTLMWSATWPREIQQLAREFLSRDHVQFNIGTVDVTANHNVTQLFEFCSSYEKRDRFMRFLERNIRDGRMIVFTGTKRMADELTRHLRQSGYPALGIHGDKGQVERDYVMNQFKSGESPICIATDVAARGLDVHDIRYVVNYDMAACIEDYVHRIGRTARAGKRGTSWTLLTQDDAKMARDLIRILREANQPVPDQLKEFAEARFQGRGGRGGPRDRWGRAGGGSSGITGANAIPTGRPSYGAPAAPSGYPASQMGGPPQGMPPMMPYGYYPPPPMGYPPQGGIPPR